MSQVDLVHCHPKRNRCITSHQASSSKRIFFVPRNIGPDCDTIGHLLYDYGEKFILSALGDGIILSVKDPVFGHKECQDFPGAFLGGWLARANRLFLSPKEIRIFRKKITLIQI